MSCEICGRSSCIRSFHRLEEQEKFDKYSKMDEQELISEIDDLNNTIELLREELRESQSTSEIKVIESNRICDYCLGCPNPLDGNCCEFDRFRGRQLRANA